MVVVEATTIVLNMGNGLIFATQITAWQRICKGEDQGEMSPLLYLSNRTQNESCDLGLIILNP